MKHRLAMLFIMIFSLVLLMTSCSQPGVPDYLVGGVHLKAEGSCDAACILLEQVLTGGGSAFQLNGAGPRGYSVERLNTEFPWRVNRLPAGNWVLQLDVKDASGTVVLQGYSTVLVRPGSLDQVTFTLAVPTAANQVASPMFAPSPGTIPATQPISLSCSTADALLYYTIDGSTPTSSSTRYTAPFSLPASSTVKAIALKEGMESSAVTQATYSFATQRVSQPVMNPVGGTYTSAQRVAITTSTEHAEIRYTTDGSTPTASSALYVQPVEISRSLTLKALAVKSGMENSSVTSTSYVLQVAQPTFVQTDTSFTDSATVSLACATEGAAIRYTLDGSTPTSASMLYTAPLTLTDTTTIKVLATKSGWVDSAVVQATYTKQASVVKPLIQTSAGVGGISVSISCATEGAAIHYTTDGSSPLSTSPTYTAPFIATQAMTVQAIAYKSGMAPSAVASQSLAPERVATPLINPSGTVFSPSMDVFITCPTPSVVIHYTIDGSTPSAASLPCTGSIHITDTTVVKAIAVKDGMVNSLVATETYTVRTTVADPVFTPLPIASGFNTAQSVTISCPTEGSVIYYTSAIGDASIADPTSASTRYTGPIAIPETTTIKAIALKADCNDSAVVTKTYTINGSIIIEF